MPESAVQGLDHTPACMRSEVNIHWQTSCQEQSSSGGDLPITLGFHCTERQVGNVPIHNAGTCYRCSNSLVDIFPCIVEFGIHGSNAAK